MLTHAILLVVITFKVGSMDFFGISPLEILLILMVAFMVLGPEKLPQYARTAGRYVREFRRMSQDVRTQVTRELSIDMTDEQGNKVGLEQYIVQIKSDVTGALTDVKQSLTTETAAIKSALTIDPKLIGNVSSDTITSTVITNPDTAQAETVFETVVPVETMATLSAPVMPDLPPNMRRTRIHVLKLDDLPEPAPAQVEPTLAEPNNVNVLDVIKEGTTWSEYEQGLSISSDELSDVEANKGLSRKPRISKRGGYAGSRPHNN